MDHRLLDRRNLLMHQRVTGLLRARPERLGEAVDLVARWRTSAGPRVLPVLDEWAAILEAGLERTLAVALDPSDEGDRLRQSSPLLSLLGARARWALLRELRDSDAAQ